MGDAHGMGHGLAGDLVDVGSWLPGDPRGFRTRRGREYVAPPAPYAKDGEPIYDPEHYRERYERAKVLAPNAVRLTTEELDLAKAALLKEVAGLPLRPLVLAVGRQHFHLVSEFHGTWIRTTVGRLKAAITLAIPNPGDRKRLWTKECNMESLEGDAAVCNAVHYVYEHVHEGAQVHVWPTGAVYLRSNALEIAVDRRIGIVENAPEHTGS